MQVPVAGEAERNLIVILFSIATTKRYGKVFIDKMTISVEIIDNSGIFTFADAETNLSKNRVCLGGEMLIASVAAFFIGVLSMKINKRKAPLFRGRFVIFIPF